MVRLVQVIVAGAGWGAGKVTARLWWDHQWLGGRLVKVDA